jgi:hypothetical protein
MYGKPVSYAGLLWSMDVIREIEKGRVQVNYLTILSHSKILR